MTTAVFDTLKASRKLKAAGIEEAQAEAIVQSMAEAFDDSVATKADLKAAIAEVKADMLKTAIAVVVANVSLTVALIKLL
jgi:hypothetical protein